MIDSVTRQKITQCPVVVFYGSQTGTSEKLAQKFQKEFESSYGLKTGLINLNVFSNDNVNHNSDLNDTENDKITQCDIQNESFDIFSIFPDDKLYVFFISSYGDGEQADSALQFYNYLKATTSATTSQTTKRNFRYSIFGIGSSLYEFYQQAAIDINKELQRLGCELVGTFGKGDDGKGILDEDYNDWKFDMMPLIASQFGIMSQLKNKEYTESFKVISNVGSKKFAQGEIVGSLRDLMFINRPPFHESKPFIAKFENFKVVYDLQDDTQNERRTCLHCEIDLSGSKLKYETGDHVGIYTSNDLESVELFLRVFGLSERQDEVMNVIPVDRMSTQLWFPTPVSLKALAQYYLEINGP
ncbi:unnamed protein product, partial [Ambrosiozyma monospora]